MSPNQPLYYKSAYFLSLSVCFSDNITSVDFVGFTDHIFFYVSGQLVSQFFVNGLHSKPTWSNVLPFTKLPAVRHVLWSSIVYISCLGTAMLESYYCRCVIGHVTSYNSKHISAQTVTCSLLYTRLTRSLIETCMCFYSSTAVLLCDLFSRVILFSHPFRAFSGVILLWII